MRLPFVQKLLQLSQTKFLHFERERSRLPCNKPRQGVRVVLESPGLGNGRVVRAGNAVGFFVNALIISEDDLAIRMDVQEHIAHSVHPAKGLLHGLNLLRIIEL
jgi:hypothetical protein